MNELTRITNEGPPLTPSAGPALDSGYSLDPIDAELMAPPSHFQVQRLLIFLRRFWWIPVLTLVLSLGACVVFVLFMPPTFVSKASMWETVKLRLPEGTLFSEDAQDFLGTQSQLLQSTTLRDMALSRLQASAGNTAIPRQKDGQPIPVDIKVSGSGKSTVFVLEATSSQAAFTQVYLNALMDAYLEYKRNIRKVVSGDTLASITEQVQRTAQDLEGEREKLMAFERTNNYAILQEEGTISGGYLAKLKTELSDLELESRLLKAATSDQSGSGRNMTNLNAGLVEAMTLAGSTPAAGAATEQQNTFNDLELLKLQRQRLSRYLRPKHPKIVKLDADIDRAEKLQQMFRQQNREQLAASLEANQLKTENVKASIKEWEVKVVDANARLAEAERLKLNVQRAQTVYDRLVLMEQNVGISRNIDQENLAILEPASPAKRSYTQEIGLLAAGTVGGLGLGLGLIFLIAVRDDRLTSLREIRDKVGELIVGQVPEVQSLEKGSPLHLLENNDQRHAYAESFRSLRSALFYMSFNGVRPKTLLITSAVPNEGKSTVAANLARTLVLGGSRVVLVDGDLRRGTLHRLLGLQRGPGLAEVLRQPETLEKVIQRESLLNFAFISSGSVSTDSGDLLLGPAFDQILGWLRLQFDYVLFDSSPVFAADDSSTVAPKLDGTLFVVRSRFSGARPVREALDILHQRGARVLGVIFNQADVSARSYYYYKYPEGPRKSRDRRQ